MPENTEPSKDPPHLQNSPSLPDVSSQQGSASPLPDKDPNVNFPVSSSTTRHHSPSATHGLKPLSENASPSILALGSKASTSSPHLPHHQASSVSFAGHGLSKSSAGPANLSSPALHLDDSAVYRGSYGAHSSYGMLSVPSPSAHPASPLSRSRPHSRTRSSGRITPAHSFASGDDNPFARYRRRNGRRGRHSSRSEDYDDSSDGSSSDNDEDSSDDDTNSRRKKKSSGKVNPQSYLERMLFGGGGISGDGMPAVRSGFGLEEFRDGFFDAIYSPISFIEKLAYESVTQESEVMALTEKTSSIYSSLISSLTGVVHNLISAANLVKLFKAFIAYFVAYILCVIGPVGEWFGHYRLFLPLACILHQAGHSSGSQIEILVQCAGGMALGLGVGALGDYVSTSTQAAQAGYGGLQAVSVVLLTFVAAWIRASYIRLYHGMIAFHMAHLFMAVVNVSEVQDWYRARQFAVPYSLGVALTLVFNLIIVPDFFHGEIFSSFTGALEQCKSTIVAISHAEPDALAREVENVNRISNEVSMTFREMLNEITISTVSNSQAIQLRNALQMFIGRIRVVPCPTYLYGPLLSDEEYSTLTGSDDAHYRTLATGTTIRKSHVFIRDTFQEPTSAIIQSVLQSIDTIAEVLQYLKYPLSQSSNATKYYSDLAAAQDNLKNCQYALDMLSDSLLLRAEQQGVNVEWRATPVVNVLVYVHYLYDMSRSLGHVMEELGSVAGSRRSWKISFLNYPFLRALKINTRQTTHDRGGQSAFYFYHTKSDIEKVFEQLHEINSYRRETKQHKKHSSEGSVRHEVSNSSTPHAGELDNRNKLRYKLWKIAHRLQGYESRFAVRTSITVTTLCIPGWIRSSSGWYNNYNLWIAPFIAVLMMHPRVGGNFHDLIIRTTFAILGVVWGGISFRARYGNPYVMCIMCAVFMIPAFYRYVISSHPRSGSLACISFTVTSLTIFVNIQEDHNQRHEIVVASWTQGCAIVIGIAGSILISWMFWPFVARHEVRKAMAIVLRHLSKCYQTVTDRYLYKDIGDEPTALSLSLSEVREARMRISLDAYMEMITMTKHEPSLRGDFDQVPYIKLLKSSQVILQKISEARISSIYFNVHRYEDTDAETKLTLMSLRRDAVASVIYLLHLLSSAFASKNKILSHMPSPALSRKLLFDGMHEIERMRRKAILEAARLARDEADVASYMDKQEGVSGRSAEVGKGGDGNTRQTARDTSAVKTEEVQVGDSDESMPEVNAGEAVIALARSNDDVNEKSEPNLEPTTTIPLPPHASVLEKSQYIWAIVHESTFSQTFTEIAQELEKMIAYGKYILGEEEIWTDVPRSEYHTTL